MGRAGEAGVMNNNNNKKVCTTPWGEKKTVQEGLKNSLRSQVRLIGALSIQSSVNELAYLKEEENINDIQVAYIS